MRRGDMAGGVLAIICAVGITAAVAVAWYGSRADIPGIAAPAPPPRPALELRDSLDLPNGLHLYSVGVDAKPAPYQCLILASPQGATLHCDIDSLAPDARQ